MHSAFLQPSGSLGEGFGFRGLALRFFGNAFGFGFHLASSAAVTRVYLMVMG